VAAVRPAATSLPLAWLPGAQPTSPPASKACSPLLKSFYLQTVSYRSLAPVGQPQVNNRDSAAS
jgi:hypothetical protein